MEKDFDQWNEKKKTVHRHDDVIGVHERELWWISFGLNVGVEIDGKQTSFERPGIILRKFNNHMLWVVPTTSQQKSSPFYERFIFDNGEYFAALTQLRTISTKRLLRKIGMISAADFGRMQAGIVTFVRNERTPARGEGSRRPKP